MAEGRRHSSSELVSPDGRNPLIRTVWIVESERLKAGDVGTVVHLHKKGEAYEIEFMTLNGETVTVATLLASQVRPIEPREIVHARTLIEA
jgi:hypothetical protein